MAMFSSTSPSEACKHQIKPETPEFDTYRPHFGWVNADTLKRLSNAPHNGEPQLPPSP